MPLGAEQHAVPSERLCCFTGICTYGDNLKDETFKEKLGEVSIKEITKTARERRAGSLGYAEAMLLIYNKKLKNPLQWNILLSSKVDSKAKKNAAVPASVPQEKDSRPETGPDQPSFIDPSTNLQQNA